VRLCRVTTSDLSLAALFRGQHRYFIERGYEVWGAALPDSGCSVEAEAEGLRFQPVPMSRRFGVLEDLRGLIALYRFFRREDFDVVEASTLKAEFLATVAAWLARVPLRVVTLRALPYELNYGLVGIVIKNMIRVACRLSHQVLPICHEIRERCEKDNLCNIDKVRVVLAGSSNGVDLRRFTLTDELRDEGREIRQRAGFPDDAIVVGIVARLKIEKGLCELIEAFRSLEDRWPQLRLLVVGDFETMQDPVPPDVEDVIRNHPRIHFAGLQGRTDPYYAAMDVLALPTHREGFGNVIIEASAMELPVITCDTMGCREAAADGESGILVPVGDAEALAVAIERLLADEALRTRLGQQGRRRIEELFDQQEFWPALEAVYRGLLGACRLPLPQERGTIENRGTRDGAPPL
jgi:glycosyltransferase involved in cell wall biosynthesis